MKSIRARWLLLVASALTVIGVAVVPSFAAAESPESNTAETNSVISPLGAEGCSANVVCIYRKAGYEEAYFDANCSSGGRVWSGPNMHSIRNRCGNKTAWIRDSEITIHCIPPGGEAENPGTFNELVLSSEYGNKC